MNKPDPDRKKKAREERLAAKLRENLHRRKGQAREQYDEGVGDQMPTQGCASESELSKARVCG